ncbi:hybrid sensor histidine kinase/response regulator [Leptolyngbya sp. NIES-2104]|uniref:hybrid sensor histidine kinase/response regulator n=1 Tax=Leptolyngbya sp. NIES-2104 TaxID=1552121 RepID=UPI0006EC6FB2|nr:response regulator [Leptolyngbya sp. NIES-2104]GAP96307.1 serine/threonine protein kinase PrkC [Leptolyngbya sp. NIES-2104]
MNFISSDSVRILLVDDTPTNLKVLSEALQGQGWKTLMAIDGESAIEQAEYAIPDLILLDVMMPGIDGFETCQRFKANLKLQLIPIIFMTALSDAVNKVRGLELGAVDYITKPFQQEEVIARVKLHLSLSQLNRSLKGTIEEQARTQAQLEELTQQLEQRVHDRTIELENSIQQLNTTQLQLIQSEKMSTLGQLVAGIGHEINNPINFVGGNLKHIEDYTQDLFTLIEMYQTQQPDAEIEEFIEDVDLEYLIEDMPKLIRSIHEGVDRLRDISFSLRSFARSDISSKVEYQIHEGIESTLMLLKHRLKADEQHPEIQINRNYGDLFPIRCYPGQLNQVFMNLIANALDVFEEQNVTRSYEEVCTAPNVIWISTAIDQSTETATIRIKDNGFGISPEIQSQIFEPSFTTKPVGKGTGLGLAISRQIIVEKHGGKLDCHSVIGQGTEFTIVLPV